VRQGGFPDASFQATLNTCVKRMPTPVLYLEAALAHKMEAQRRMAERRFRTQGVRLAKGRWLAHPEATDGPVPTHTTFLLGERQFCFGKTDVRTGW
jgi:hypothetical protein